ncbi:hypothetical protein MA16_Dca003677 [Dendrobium catenatum]|uniref:Uncharacterized protein n=1 Tax=Dendrobium catenatum TaxID=906689 RepID=A0A2I0WFM3_9ASPA|nr:hypothetical protein MA16_Dca003677 [Dendrobium catenatum]
MASAHQSISILIITLFLFTAYHPCAVRPTTSLHASPSPTPAMSSASKPTAAAEIYQPLLLNVLPRGSFYHSGPSSGTNEYDGN